MVTEGECFELSKPGSSKQTRDNDGPVAAMESQTQVSIPTAIQSRRDGQKEG